MGDQSRHRAWVCKGPKVGTYFICSEMSREASVVGAERVRK